MLRIVVLLVSALALTPGVGVGQQQSVDSEAVERAERKKMRAIQRLNRELNRAQNEINRLVQRQARDNERRTQLEQRVTALQVAIQAIESNTLSGEALNELVDD